MKTRLLNGLEAGVQDQVRGEYLSSARMRRRLAEILEGDIEVLYKSMRDDSNYGEAAWPFHQAEKIGEFKALKKIVGLLE